jgi:hypothetical protein
MKINWHVLPSVLISGVLGASSLLGPKAAAQLAYEGIRMDERYKVYIYSKESLGPGEWRFQTKAVFASGAKPYYSDWRTVNCFESTIDGKTVPVVARYGVETGEPEVFKAVCGYR